MLGAAGITAAEGVLGAAGITAAEGVLGAAGITAAEGVLGAAGITAAEGVLGLLVSDVAVIMWSSLVLVSHSPSVCRLLQAANAGGGDLGTGLLRACWFCQQLP